MRRRRPWRTCSRKLAVVTIVGEIPAVLRVRRTRFMVTHTCRPGCQTCSNTYLCTKLRAAETRTIPRVRPIKPSRSRGLTLIAKNVLLLFAVLATYTVFFSSRRLPTRCYRDWSSDVCSSDLTYGVGLFTPIILGAIDVSGKRGGVISHDFADARGSAAIDLFLLFGFLLG